MLPKGRCPEAQRLLDIYTAALEQYQRDWPPYSFSSLGAGPQFQAVKAAQEEARKKVFQAHEKYAAHIKRHRCKDLSQARRRRQRPTAESEN